MSALFFREGRLLALAVLMIVALGGATILTIGRQEDPTITNIFATIVTPYPGASPDRVEALVTEKIEAELRGIPEIKNIDSMSGTGVSSIQIELSEFTPKGRIEQVWAEVRDALTDAASQFPPGVPEPEFDDDRIGSYTSIAALTPSDPANPPSDAVLARYAEALEDRLRRLAGTAFTRVYGAAREEILVEIDADRLASLGLTPVDVSHAIAAADAKASAGRVRGRGSDYLLSVSGEIESLERIAEAPILAVSAAVDPTAPILRVSDVATIRRAAQEPPEDRALHNGRSAVLVAARMEPDLQVDKWAERLRGAMAGFAEELPPSLSLELIFDQSEYTLERLGELVANLGFGVAIVVGVLLLTLGWRSALIVGAILPLASLGSLFVLQMIGIVVHQMSVTGLIVALGLLVDAGIVVADDIAQRLRAGATRLAAVSEASKRLALPLAASTATTILAFVPMASLPGPAGDFVGSIALSVMVMLVVSLALALTVTPALAGRLLPMAEQGAAQARETLAIRLYRRLVRFSIRHPLAAIAASLSPAVIGFASFGFLTAQFFPGVERDQFYVQVTLPTSASIYETERIASRIDAALRAKDGVRAVSWVVGRNAPAFYYNMLSNRDNAPHFAEALVTARSAEDAGRLIYTLQTTLDRLAPEAQTLVRGLVQGPPVVAPIEMRLYGANIDVLRRLGEEARLRMAALPMVTHARAEIAGGAPELVFEFDEDKLRLAGMSLTEAAQRLAALVEGVEGGSLVEGPEELPVRVRLAAGDRASADRILDLKLATPSATTGFPATPLTALGEVRLAPGASVIQRRNGERLNTVQAFLLPGVLPEEALRALRADLTANPMALPDGYRIAWGGDTDARDQVINNLLSSVTLVAVLTLATLVITFNSWRLTVISLIVCGLSFGLSILSLALFQYPFGINALLGAIGSIGVSINAAIIILSALKDDPRAATGDTEAITDVVVGATRHIVSTTITTFGGFAPLILAGGLFWPPFATAIAGGVLLSTIVSLFFTPPMFRLLAFRGYGRGMFDAPPAPAAV